MRTKVSEKGQITVPKPLRDRLGIRPGDELDLVYESSRLVATKSVPEDPWRASTGSSAPTSTSTA